MHASRVLQFLSVPAALGLGTALILACSDGGPTAPDQISSVETGTIFTAPKKGGGGGEHRVLDDVDNVCTRHNYTRTAVGIIQSYIDVDLAGNNNGYVCTWSHSGGGPPKK